MKKKNSDTITTSIILDRAAMRLVDYYTEKRNITRVELLRRSVLKEIIADLNKTELLKTLGYPGSFEKNIETATISIDVPVSVKKIVDKYCFEVGADKSGVWVLSVLKKHRCATRRHLHSVI